MGLMSSSIISVDLTLKFWAECQMMVGYFPMLLSWTIFGTSINFAVSCFVIARSADW